MASILKPRNLPPGVSLQRLEGFNWEDVSVEGSTTLGTSSGSGT